MIQHLGGGVGTDAQALTQRRRGLGGESIQVTVVVHDLDGEREPATGERCFRHQLLLPSPYLVLTKPLRLDIQCQSCVATSGLRRQDGPPLASTVPGPPSCPATIRSNGASSKPALILQCVRWYLRYALSYRDLEDMMRERGLCVDHTTIYRWVQRYAPEIDKRCRPFLRRTNDSYRIDETYVRVAGAWTYLYRGVDSNGDTLDFLLRATRDRKAAIAFFRKTLGAAHTTPPRVVTVDKNPAYPVAFEAVRHEGLVRPRSNLRQCKYLNNIIEQDHRFIKRRTRPMLGFKRFTRRGGPCAASRSCMRSARDRRDGWRRATWSGRRS